MRWSALVLLLCGCDHLFRLDRPDGGGATGPRRIAITQSTATTLVDFPVSIVITDADLALRARPDGSDIRFTDVNDTTLPHEIVAYSDGALEAWVKVTLGQTTEIRMAYGEAPRPVADLPWSTVFAAAWHLSESTGGARDSTANAFDVNPETADKTPDTARGIVGNARAYTDSLLAPMRQMLCAAPNRRFNMGNHSFGFSAWINAEPLVGAFNQAVSAGGLTDGQGGFAFELNANAWYALVSDSDPGATHLAVSFQDRPLGRWVHLAAVVDRPGDQMRLYLDGFLATTRTPLADIDDLGDVVSERPICLGGEDGYGGLLDEVRVYDDLVSPEWIRAEFDNVNDRAAFVRLDP